MTVASAGASITVSRACVNRFQKLLDHGQSGSYVFRFSAASDYVAPKSACGKFHQIGTGKRACVHEWKSSRLVQTGNYPVVDVTSPLSCDFTFARSSDAAKLDPRSGLPVARVLPEGSSCASRRRKIRGPLPATVESAESVGGAEWVESTEWAGWAEYPEKYAPRVEYRMALTHSVFRLR
jgi:hypothetical protein